MPETRRRGRRPRRPARNPCINSISFGRSRTTVRGRPFLSGGASPSPRRHSYRIAPRGMRDVEDAVPYGSETVGRLRDGGRGKPLPYGDGCTGVREVQRDVEDAVPYGSETVGRLRDGGMGKPLPYGGRMNAGAGTGDTSSAPVCALGHLPLKGKASGTSRTPSPRIRSREAVARPGRRGAKGKGTRGAKGKSCSCRKRRICSCGAKSPCNIPPRRYNKEWETEYTEGEIRSHG